MEIRSWLDYNGIEEGLNYWHTLTGQEVDFIVKEEVAIEVKSTSNVSGKDMKGIKAIMEEGLLSKYIIVCREKYPQLLDNGILLLPYKEFLEQLWNGEIV